MARGANRQHPRRVAGAGDAAVLHLPIRGCAEIARRRHDDDARINGAACGERQGVGVIGLEDAGRHRQIDDTDVVDVLDRDRVINSRDHVAQIPVPLGVEHFESHELCFGRDTRPGAAGVEAVARDNAGGMGAVAVLI